MDYIESFWDWQYTESLIREQEELQSHINRCLAINESSPIFILEADDNKGFFQRINNFFQRIWDKFKEKLNNMFMNDKQYLERYKTIIIGRAPKIDVTMHDWFTGINRINDAISKTTQYLNSASSTDFATAKIIETVKRILTDTDGNDEKISAKLKDIKKEILTDHVFEGDSKFTITDVDESVGTIKNFFRGGEDEEEFTADDLGSNDRMKIIFNSLYSIENFKKGIQNLQNVYNKGIDSMSKSYDEIIKSQQSASNESTRIYGTNILNELEISSNNNKSDSSISSSSATKAAKDTKSNLNAAKSDAKEAIDKNKKGLENDNDGLNAALKQDDKKIGDNEVAGSLIANTAKKYYSEVSNTCVSVITCAFTIAEEMRKDFRKLVRAHVNSYLTDKEGDKTHNTGTTTTSQSLGSNISRKTNTEATKNTKGNQNKPQVGEGY